MWYLRYPLSYRNEDSMMLERGLTVDSRVGVSVGPGLCARTQTFDAGLT